MKLIFPNQNFSLVAEKIRLTQALGSIVNADINARCGTQVPKVDRQPVEGFVEGFFGGSPSEIWFFDAFHTWAVAFNVNEDSPSVVEIKYCPGYAPAPTADEAEQALLPWLVWKFRVIPVTTTYKVLDDDTTHEG